MARPDHAWKLSLAAGDTTALPDRLTATSRVLYPTLSGPLGVQTPTDSLDFALAGVEDPTDVLAEPGRRVGRYLLVEPLGAGGQAVVWRAVQHEPVVREVALKMLAPGLHRDRRRVARLRREAERAARFAHPSILPIYEFGEHQEVVFLAMPIVEGASLAELIACRKRRGEGRVGGDAHWLLARAPAEYIRATTRLVARVARALEAAHAAWVVHRDVKPANILLDREREDRVFLTDFGMARDLDVATRPQLRDGAGTLLYMAPEKLLGCQDDEVRCDVYALGVTMFEALTLERPYQMSEPTSRVVLAAHLATHGPLRPRDVQPRLSRDLEAIILKAMAPEPARRYATAAALAIDLEQFLAGAPPRVRVQAAADLTRV
jgi:serine/threonine-protein kinase